MKSFFINRTRIALLLGCGVAILGAQSATASTAYGSINNFDAVNDTGQECHGFEIEVEDIHSQDVSYTYDWNHYGTPTIAEDNSDPAHPRVFIRYASTKKSDGSWSAYTAIPAGPIAPTDGHMFTNPNVNFGGEHFGAGFMKNPGRIAYYWMVDDGAGALKRGPQVMVSTPTFTYIPPANGMPAQVQAAIIPAPAEPRLEFGPATWVKEIRTTTHNSEMVMLRDLVSDDPDDEDDRNWRNNEPDEVEVEWQLLQEEFGKVGGGENGELKAAPENLNNNDEVVTRRYEFYKYTGPFDNETGEAKGSKVADDGVHGEGIKRINDVDVDLSQIEVVGEYIGAQMSAFDAGARLGLIEHVQDGVAGDAYPIRTLIIAGAAPFTASVEGALPLGIEFDPITGQLSGTPLEAGAFTFTVRAMASDEAPLERSYTLTVLQPGVEAEPRTVVDTISAPLNGGSTIGDGSYALESGVTVTAIPSPGYAFASWTENGEIVSHSASYTFTNIVNVSLVANFVPAPPALSITGAEGNILVRWPATQIGYVLQRSAAVSEGWSDSVVLPESREGWLEITLPVEGSLNQFFRLIKR